ncbi:MAG TPA: diphthine--ammonia ligase [Methanomassiliicoccaceae archaeon]|jgi:diphthine-ammonia ligase|nr:diphthine--ammonia ligase [Euryarchaeota archaeon]HOB39076.1 diphthine--ammonia ligase [Methanomassiliicoccaceae archaeon]HOL07205.1 diphthine--ammonia ligase [Methanomassiliicoccaceae archaeon]HOQ25372.1 diphthine--ammonia ligase [Methanomassiliicoccaceae archaeon]HPP45781.1 diphthine--ammonia ligase [Methanomassiliicoccaceae archaeon]
MRLALLFSGGKDSTYAAYIMTQMGHRIVALVSVVPSDAHSWVFHVPNLRFLPQMAEAMGLPLHTECSTGEEESDLEALRKVLSGLEVDGVVTGAIASDYQWDRMNQVCEDLGIRTFSPLWRKEQDMLLEDMILSGVRFVPVRVSCEGLDGSWLGREIDIPALNDLRELSERYGINISGEGGEYETLVLDSPLHRARLDLRDVRKEMSRDEGNLIIGRVKLEVKDAQ